MNLSDLRGILQYVPRFRDKTFVIAVDGEIVASENLGNILTDIAVLRSLNIRIVLVHGARTQIERLAGERGVALSNSDGTGITDDATLRVAIEASTKATHDLMQGLTTVDLRAAFANAIIAHPAGILGGVDQLNTGRVERVDARSLQLLLGEGIVPVVPPLGFDGEGKTFRVNSDAVAVEVAEALGAMKIIFLTSREGVRLGGDLLRQISISEAEDILKKRRSALDPVVVSKLDYAARACRAGVPRVHILDGNRNEAVLEEVFSHDGIGTMVHSNEYQQIRRIWKKDVRAVMALIRQSVHQDELIRRTRAEILARIEDYWALEIDRALVGCVALHADAENKIGEVACLYVHKSHAGQGYGRKLVAFVEGLARDKGLERVYALSTQAFAFFQQKAGFVEVGPEVLPPGRREKYAASQRHSKVLLKEITPKGIGAGS